MRDITYMQTSMGWIRLEAEGKALVAVRFVACEGERVGDCAVLQQAAEELEEYFAGERKVFCVPVRMRGTEFQEKVWSALREIPYGETWSYGELAKRIGQPRAVRAVGGACHRNPLPIIVPCHRVIGKNGALTGYAEGLERKYDLLALEHSFYEGTARWCES